MATPDQIKEEQELDDTLVKMRKLTKENYVKDLPDGGQATILYRKGLIYRDFRSPRVSNGKTFRQLIVPKKFRPTVMRLANESMMARHLGIKKTVDRFLAEFYWPGVRQT